MSSRFWTCETTNTVSVERLKLVLVVLYWFIISLKRQPHWIKPVYPERKLHRLTYLLPIRNKEKIGETILQQLPQETRRAKVRTLSADLRCSLSKGFVAFLLVRGKGKQKHSKLDIIVSANCNTSDILIIHNFLMSFCFLFLVTAIHFPCWFLRPCPCDVRVVGNKPKFPPVKSIFPFHLSLFEYAD